MILGAIRTYRRMLRTPPDRRHQTNSSERESRWGLETIVAGIGLMATIVNWPNPTPPAFVNAYGPDQGVFTFGLIMLATAAVGLALLIRWEIHQHRHAKRSTSQPGPPEEPSTPPPAAPRATPRRLTANPRQRQVP